MGKTIERLDILKIWGGYTPHIDEVRYHGDLNNDGRPDQIRLRHYDTEENPTIYLLVSRSDGKREIPLSDDVSGIPHRAGVRQFWMKDNIAASASSGSQQFTPGDIVRLPDGREEMIHGFLFGVDQVTYQPVEMGAYFLVDSLNPVETGAASEHLSFPLSALTLISTFADWQRQVSSIVNEVEREIGPDLRLWNRLSDEIDQLNDPGFTLRGDAGAIIDFVENYETRKKPQTDPLKERIQSIRARYDRIVKARLNQINPSKKERELIESAVWDTIYSKYLKS